MAEAGRWPRHGQTACPIRVGETRRLPVLNDPFGRGSLIPGGPWAADDVDENEEWEDEGEDEEDDEDLDEDDETDDEDDDEDEFEDEIEDE
jgi:hypothetical protein